MPAARTGNNITVLRRLRVPFQTAAPAPEEFSVVVVFSIVTGSPVRESFCTRSVVTVFWLEHAPARFMVRSRAANSLEILRITFLHQVQTSAIKLHCAGCPRCVVVQLSGRRELYISLFLTTQFTRDNSRFFAEIVILAGVMPENVKRMPGFAAKFSFARLIRKVVKIITRAPALPGTPPDICGWGANFSNVYWRQERATGFSNRGSSAGGTYHSNNN